MIPRGNYQSPAAVDVDGRTLELRLLTAEVIMRAVQKEIGRGPPWAISNDVALYGHSDQ